MKIRRYTASTMQEAMLKIKLDLGPEAIILHSRKFKQGGFLGFFGKDMIEVLAAIDGDSKPEPKPEPKLDPKPEPRPEPKPEPKVVSTPDVTLELGPQAQLTTPEPPVVVAQKVPADPPKPEKTEKPENVDRQELEDIKASISEIKNILRTVTEHVENQPNRSNWTAVQQKIYDRLIRAEIDPIVARGFIAQLARNGISTYEEGLEHLTEPIAGLVKVSGAIQPKTTRIVALIGPTGVGKTTTIAKLAANYRLNGPVEIGLITIDTYRVAAVEQLKTYGDIIGIPVEVVTTPVALKEALANFSNKDLVLIDTAGRSPSNRMHLNELKVYLDAAPGCEKHLVVSATTNRASLKRLYDSFLPTGIDHLIVTKMDEASTLGAVFSAMHQWGKTLSYITTGQSVPDDIRIADPQYFAQQLVGELKR